MELNMDENEVRAIKKECDFSINGIWLTDVSYTRHCALATKHKNVYCNGTNKDKLICPFWKDRI